MDVIPEIAVTLVRRFEGLKLAPYHDSAGFPTIGYGHLLSTEAWAPLDRWKAIDREEAERYLWGDLRRIARGVRKYVPVPLGENQYAALISFTFNVGVGALWTSALRRRIIRGDPGAVVEFGRWVYAGGVRLASLIRRRRAEADVFSRD